MRGAGERGADLRRVGTLAGPPAAPGAEDPMVPNHAVRIGFQLAPSRAAAASCGRRPNPAPTGGARARERRPDVALARRAGAGRWPQRLDALRAEAARAAGPASRRSTPLWCPPRFACRTAPATAAPLTLSAPAFAGDTAFVETAYACGTTCGNGSLYALQRRDGRWEVVGVADIWIS